jgi:hypothetical protein
MMNVYIMGIQALLIYGDVGVGAHGCTCVFFLSEVGYLDFFDPSE